MDVHKSTETRYDTRCETGRSQCFRIRHKWQIWFTLKKVPQAQHTRMTKSGWKVKNPLRYLPLPSSDMTEITLKLTRRHMNPLPPPYFKNIKHISVFPLLWVNVMVDLYHVWSSLWATRSKRKIQNGNIFLHWKTNQRPLAFQRTALTPRLIQLDSSRSVGKTFALHLTINQLVWQYKYEINYGLFRSYKVP